MKDIHYIIYLCVLFVILSCQPTPPTPTGIGPLPAERQIMWNEMEFYGFVHFNMNTFSNMEWGLGDETPEMFNPTALDTRQWARICKEAGMKGIILTAKHHDGFCLWPSKYTEHSVKNSPWKNGQGDVVKELAEACKAYGLKMGIYLSPWDRNHPDYGTPEYITYFRNQLRELLTNYGEIFEVWFDGANGGSGFYGGANETRRVDKKSYYDWPGTIEIIRELQPHAVVFSDAGPGVRWVGNEEGWANETNWSLLRKADVYPGMPEYKQLRSGHEDGTHWIPAECDVSIRPGWYYHRYEDEKVKSLSRLVDIYYHSVGRNASLLLNLPVDTRGLIHENDAAQLLQLGEIIRNDFETDLAPQAQVQTSSHRGGYPAYEGSNVIDGNSGTYWTTDDSVTTGSITLEFEDTITFNRFMVQEFIPLGQRVSGFTLEAWMNDQWEIIDRQTTIGRKRILRFEPISTQKVRFSVTQSKGCPLITHIGLYQAPALLTEPKVKRDKLGKVTMEAPEPGLEIHFTLDGNKPGPNSELYTEPLMITQPTELQVLTYDPRTKRQSEVVKHIFDISKQPWSVSSVSSGDINAAYAMIDDDPNTFWRSEDKALPQYVVVDLGEKISLRGFTYLPVQRWYYIDGTITEYEVYISNNGRRWRKPVMKGEFSNIQNNPMQQEILFEKPVDGRYLKLVATNVINDNGGLSVAEIGVITAQ